MRVFGIYSAMGSAGLLAASAIFSLFLHGDASLSALLTVFSYWFSLVLTIFSTEVENHVENSGNFRKLAFDLLRALKNRKRFLLFLVAAALLSECNQTITVFLNQLQYLRGGIRPDKMGLLYIPVLVAGLLLYGGRAVRRLAARGEPVNTFLFTFRPRGVMICLLLMIYSIILSNRSKLVRHREIAR